ncbi:MAG: IS1595 family transposase [Planctomycetes bacterium]|nr:IS1595 family transposase [Planctomycetota bacterium]
MTRKKPCLVGENKCDVIRDVPAACADKDAAVAFMEKQRWADDPCCPLCGGVDVYQMKDRKSGSREANYRWRCRDCGQKYTVRTGTVMAQTRMPLRYWCHAFWRVCSSKKSVSAKQIQRETGLSYKSALFLLHRVRFAMADMKGVKLSGTVEVDEIYIGGKPRYKGQSQRGRGTRKQPVIGMVERSGRVRTCVIPDVTGKTLKDAVQQHVRKASRIITDEWPAYRKAVAGFDGGHSVVNHSMNEYVRGDVTTNTIESFFAILKRGLIGVYHNVSRKYLQRYLDEFEFRYNTRKVDDGERTVAAIQGAIGKRLMYREPEERAA